MTTGWALATLLPNSTTRSVSMRSVYEMVVAPTPMALFSVLVEGAWQTRAALSMLGEPRNRTTFWAT
jgi:hypothetical protein